MDKLTAQDVNKVKEALVGFIKEASSIEDSDKLNKMAAAYFGKEFADKPALVKQAAAAFNSNKSIAKFASADTAASDFALLDGNKLFEKIAGQSYNHTIEKAAGGRMAVVFGKETTLNKVASAPTASPKPIDRPAEEDSMSTVSLYNYINDVTKDRERLIAKIAARKDICKFEAINVTNEFCRRLASLSKEARAAAVNNILSVYPVDGKALIEAFNAYSPLDKVATASTSRGTKSFPTGDIYTKANECMVANYAAKQSEAMFKEACADTLYRYKRLPGLYTMYKHAAGLTSSIGKAALAHPIINEIADGNSLKTSDVYGDVMSKKLINELRELETKNVLVDMYSEPFIASYPAEDIEEATVKALHQLPPEQRKHPRKHVALLKTWVADILGRGGNMSASDADRIINTQTAFSKSRAQDLADIVKDFT